MSSPLYGSETRSISVTNLPSELRHLLLQHADKRKLRLAASSLWLTHRTNATSKTLFGRLMGRRSNTADPDASHDMVLVVHATHLLVATSGAKRGTSILSLPLLSATLTRGSLDGLDLPSDDGLSISGFPATAGSTGTHFMGLGAGPAAEACVLAAMTAVEHAKNPAFCRD